MIRINLYLLEIYTHLLLIGPPTLPRAPGACAVDGARDSRDGVALPCHQRELHVRRYTYYGDGPIPYRPYLTLALPLTPSAARASPSPCPATDPYPPSPTLTLLYL